MKIGVFDSGLGGLIILREIIKSLPDYDYVYLGDTKNLPFGAKTQEEIFDLTKKGVEFLFQKDCSLVLIMCNTASSKALSRLQHEWLPKYYPDKKILGPIIPTVEFASSSSRVGVFATQSTVDSGVYFSEFKKINPQIHVWQKALPNLVELLEKDEFESAQKELANAIQEFLGLRLDTLILSGCSHFALLKDFARKYYGENFKIISQDEIIPVALEEYLSRHPEIELKLNKTRNRELILTKLTPLYERLAEEWFGLGKDLVLKSELLEIK